MLTLLTLSPPPLPLHRGPSWGENGYIRLARSSRCAVDTTPLDGNGCEGGPEKVTVCGTCGVLSSSSYPVGAYLY